MLSDDFILVDLSLNQTALGSLIFPPALPPRAFAPADDEGYVFRAFPEFNVSGGLKRHPLR